MSQENVEVVRAANEAWARGDLEAIWDIYDPNVVMRVAAEWPEAGPHFGREAVVRFFEQLRDTWEAGELETISLIDAGDRVVARTRWHAVGRGPEANFEVTGVVTLRRGKIVMLEYFWDHAEALEAAGLKE
jgi:ketosteroid isomerase-like protein